jgi:hypothetical protein
LFSLSLNSVINSFSYIFVICWIDNHNSLLASNLGFNP